jgi:hypothetical protein
VTNAAKNASPVVERLSFKSAHCEEISYRLSVSREKFDVDAFRSQLMPKAKTKDEAGTVCAPKDPNTGDYHVHAEWTIGPDEVDFRIDYVEGTKDHEKDEREPYAEQFMEWLGQFFKHENAHVHIHADFMFPTEQKESKFLLPLKTSLGPKGNEAEINGICLLFPSHPEGVLDAWVLRWKRNWRVQSAANRRVTFKGFTPYEDVRAFISVFDTILEEKKP